MSRLSRESFNQLDHEEWRRRHKLIDALMFAWRELGINCSFSDLMNAVYRERSVIRNKKPTSYVSDDIEDTIESILEITKKVSISDEGRASVEKHFGSTEPS